MFRFFFRSHPLFFFLLLFPKYASQEKKAFPGSIRNFLKGINPLGRYCRTLPKNRYVWILECLGGWKRKYVKERKSHFRFSCRRFWVGPHKQGWLSKLTLASCWAAAFFLFGFAGCFLFLPHFFSYILAFFFFFWGVVRF